MPYHIGDRPFACNLMVKDVKYHGLTGQAHDRTPRVSDYGRSKRGIGSFNFEENWGVEPAPFAYGRLLLRRDTVLRNSPANRLGSHIVRALGQV